MRLADFKSRGCTHTTTDSFTRDTIAVVRETVNRASRSPAGRPHARYQTLDGPGLKVRNPCAPNRAGERRAVALVKAPNANRSCKVRVLRLDLASNSYPSGWTEHSRRNSGLRQRSRVAVGAASTAASQANQTRVPLWRYATTPRGVRLRTLGVGARSPPILRTRHPVNDSFSTTRADSAGAPCACNR